MPPPAPILHYVDGRPFKRRRAIADAILFFFLYIVGLFVSHLIAVPLIHETILHRPPAMRLYSIGELAITCVVVLVYIFHLRHHRSAYLLAPFAGLYAFLPGLLICLVAL